MHFECHTEKDKKDYNTNMKSIEIYTNDNAGQGMFVTLAFSEYELAAYLGETRNDQYRFTVSDTTLSDEEVLSSLSGLADYRTDEPVYTKDELAVNFGIIRFFELADYPEAANKYRSSLATEVLEIKINESHLGNEATMEEAEAMVEELNERGYNAEYGDTTDNQGLDEIVPDSIWQECMRKAIAATQSEASQHCPNVRNKSGLREWPTN